MNNLSNVFDYGDDSVTLMVIKTMYCTLQNALARRHVIGDEEADIYLAKHVGATDLLRVIGDEEADIYLAKHVGAADLLRVIGDEEADIYLAKRVGAADLLRVIGNEESDRVGYNLHATRVDHDLGALALK